jgi:hypothetical protein
MYIAVLCSHTMPIAYGSIWLHDQSMRTCIAMPNADWPSDQPVRIPELKPCMWLYDHYVSGNASAFTQLISDISATLDGFL